MKKTSSFSSFFAFFCFFIFIHNPLQAQYDDEKIDSSRVEVDTEKKAKKMRKPFSPNNLFVGSILNFGFFNGIFAEVSPYIGYRIFDLLAIGVGTGYAINVSANSRYNSQSYNVRAFAKLRPALRGAFSQFYFYGEYAQITGFFNNNAASTPTTPRYTRRNAIATNVGFGYTNNFAKGFGFTYEFLYDLSFDNTVSIQNSPFSMRFGVYYGF